MATTILGFYDLDAAPEHGIIGDLAERLGAATADPDLIDGAVYQRSDNGAAVLSLRHASTDAAWLDRPLIVSLLDAANWRSRSSDLRAYSSPDVEPGDEIPDTAVFVIQRFEVSAATQKQVVSGVENFVDKFARPITGFLGSEVYASNDGSRAVWISPWEYEAGLAALQSPASFADMRAFLKLAERHVFGTFQRISYLRGAHV